jgi:hypothetical protein
LSFPGDSFMSKFDWALHPEAEFFLQTKVNEFLHKSQVASNIASKIEQKTSTHFFDWIDHISIPREDAEIDNLANLGFKGKQEGSTNGAAVYRVMGSTLFPILLGDRKTKELALTVEDLDKFQSIHAPGKSVKGQLNLPLRKLVLAEKNGYVLSAVERNGSSSYVVEESDDVADYVEAIHVFSQRKRRFESDEEGLRETTKLVDHLSSSLDRQRVADAFFRSERVFWASKNTAARVQQARQDELGLGWGNRDHHTFRSGRQNFRMLIGIFQLLGLKPRERFYAGAQASWGAQILEDEVGRVVVFADVDLDAGERDTDFALQGLPARDRLDTVGLWVALHGESILQAGMHHLAARFRFEDIREDLRRKGVAMMKPFSDFPFLKQAFTQAETWQPEKERIRLLEDSGQLSHEQATRFADAGTLGSHLENIQRAQGFKGFNQDSVSAIIKWTDPRLQEEIYA